MNKIINFNNFTLFVALSLSVIAEFYAIIGLATIFAGSPIAAMIMGAIFGVAKITALVWLRKYFKIAPLSLKIYLVTAVTVLALLTSMGIFGYLSKSHSSSSLPGGEMQQQVQLIDDKIENERELIKGAKDQLTQLDAQVNNFINKGTSEKSAERSVQIRRQQQTERKSLQKEIETSNQKIAQLTEEKTPLVRELRNFEAEIGPIKYIAALIYGDNPDQNVLEKSVRWMIILIVLVFDPLAIALVLAGNHSKQYEEDLKNKQPAIVQPIEPEINLDDINKELKDAVIIKEPVEPEIFPETVEPDYDIINKKLAEVDPKETSYFVIAEKEKTFEQDYYKINHPELTTYNLAIQSNQEEVKEPVEEPIHTTPDAEMDTRPAFTDLGGGYVHFEGKRMHKRVLQSSHPELFIKEDVSTIKVGFGKELPRKATQGSVFTRVDMLPHRVYKYSGTKWFEIDKNSSTSYLSDEYLKFLTDSIQSGETDLDQLTDIERDHIRDYLLANLPNNVDKTNES